MSKASAICYLAGYLWHN